MIGLKPRSRIKETFIAISKILTAALIAVLMYVYAVILLSF